MAFLGSTGVPTSSSSSSSASSPKPSRWVSTVMSASAQSVVSDASAAAAGPSLSVHHKKDSVSHAAYDVVEEDFVAEYGATTTLYKHKKSGAEVLSVQIDDDNKVCVRVDVSLVVVPPCATLFSLSLAAVIAKTRT